MRWGIAWCAPLLWLACVNPSQVACEFNDQVVLCPLGAVCVAGGCASVDEAQACAQAAEGYACRTSLGAEGACLRGRCTPIVCGDGVRSGAEVCDDGNALDGDGCAATCLSDERCGNGVLDVVRGEACDDGNLQGGDACRPDCTFPHCGDGIVDAYAGEACDEGAANNNVAGAVCREDCQLPRCGDGILDAREACDDGNRTSGDGCNTNCTSIEVCGNGMVDAARGEACDDGNLADGDACNQHCQVPRCGDGIVDVQNGEGCDAGALNSDAPDAPCRLSCQLPRCGDGVRDDGEVCDLGAGNGQGEVQGQRCAANCLSNETCGNGYVDAVRGEQCDDGALTVRGDGCTGTCQLEPGQWRELRPSALPLVGAKLAYDSIRRRVVVASGVGSLATYEHDGLAWRQVALATAPPPRGQAQLAYDPVRRRVVSFGGDDGRFRNDTWEYDGIRWVAVPATSPPPGRVGGSFEWHARLGALVLFGGVTDTTTLDDTWRYDGGGWQQIVSTVSPSKRRQPAMAYIPSHDSLVLFGGYSDRQWYDDTWEFDGAQWRQLAVGGPPERMNAKMVYNEGRGVVTMLGGTGTGRLTDMWDFDGSAWTEHAPRLQSGDWQTSFEAAYDVHRERIVILGEGRDLSRLCDLDLATGLPSCFDPIAPPARAGHQQVWLAQANAMLLFGGRQTTPLGDTWLFRDGYWHAPLVSNAPAAREAFGMTYRVRMDDALLFGGRAADGRFFSDTWSFQGGQWQPLAVAGPSGREGLAMASHDARGEVVLFGGRDADGTRGDTWLYANAQWTLQPQAGAPAARYGHAMVYDPRRERVLLFGGADGARLFADTWIHDGQAWHQVMPSVAPGARQDATLVFHGARGRPWLLGGVTAQGRVNEVWEFDGERWHALTLGNAIPARTKMAAAFDAVTATLMLFGGEGAAGLPTNELWAHAYGTDAEPSEVCLVAPGDTRDADGDGLSACADPDCGGLCRPGCAPGTSCLSAGQCGDGRCNELLESYMSCAADCEAP